ncbi:MAG: hypothetical protein C4315_02580 [Chloroflexota bacterium]
MPGKSLANDPELRAQVRDYAGALGELGPGWEDAVAEALLAKLERRLDTLVEKRLRERRRKPPLAWFIVTLIFGIPLTATAGATAGLSGILVVWAALILINWWAARA